jgi:hypothetical protein
MSTSFILILGLTRGRGVAVVGVAPDMHWARQLRQPRF